MAGQYSLKNFLRRVPNPLLKKYFSKHKQFPVDWDSLGGNDCDPIFEAVQKLAVKQRARAESDFAIINEISDERGARAILEEGALWGKNWADSFAKMENDHARAFWTFLNHRNHFNAAGAFNEMDRYRSWWTRHVGKRLEAASKGKGFNAFKSELRKFYRGQGRGRFCDVDHYLRAGPARSCYFAYPEDMATSDVAYDDNGILVRQPRRSAFEVIFVYRHEEGDLEIHARGKKQEKEELARIFCTTILGLEELPDDSGKTPYNLECLKDPDYPLDAEPEDQVLGVELKLLRLDLPNDRKHGFGRRIQLSVASVTNTPKAVHQLIADAIDSSKLPLSDVQIGHAKMTIIFKPFEGNRETKRLTFDIRYPDRCTLKDDPYDQLAKKCLKRWGIANDR